jgi:hypothetical protein
MISQSLGLGGGGFCQPAGPCRRLLSTGGGAARKANDVLEALGLPEFVEDWVLDLNKELG